MRASPLNKKCMIGAAALAVSVGLGTVAFGDSGAAFSTFDASVDGTDICKKASIINCNIYRAKEYVWLNGGPLANGLGPDGYYFFAVLEPSGQPNPNDGAYDNLSDGFGAYTNRTFKVVDGVVSDYSGTHDLDSNTEFPSGCVGSECGSPDRLPPYIRLFPYADTGNPGGGYILAICALGQDGTSYPVEPRDCKYDFFTVREDKGDD